jgi:membrane protein YqaA with SNARE-associated domain
MFETYFFLFIDSLFASLVIPIRSEMAFHAMTTFGGFDTYVIYFTAVFGSVLGLIITWKIGKYLTCIRSSQIFQDKEETFDNIQIFWNKYVIWILPIAVFGSVGSVLCLFCGFFRTNVLHFVILVTIGRSIYYYSVL